MKKPIYLLLLPLMGLGQYRTPRFMALGEIQAVQLYDPISVSPAAAYPNRSWSAAVAGAFYLPVPELSSRMIGGAFRWDTMQGISLLAQQWGFDQITQWEAGLGYFLRLPKQELTIGVRGRMLTTTIAEFGRIHRFSPDLGAFWQPLPRLRLGAYGYNLLGVGWGRLPGNVRYGLGVAYVLPYAEISTELTQEASHPMQYRLGLQYSPHPILTVRLGAAFPTATMGAGLGLRYQRFILDLGYRYQPTLGSWIAIGLASM
ncbi:MAG: hypothetical protein NZ580_07785 [Bacteroidia bacterium]|nr:hypothetical protein [Bacteroidia bacterium]MDW8236227.1 hypothetical protein [Bacteroidia bacterium]